MAEIQPVPQTSVTRGDLSAAFGRLGLAEGDIVLSHSSMRSFGHVDGGPDTVVAALRDTVGTSGTLVFPTLVQKNFAQAYQTWDIRLSPSDVGLLSETFRLREGVLRSDQATHSVAAEGPAAADLVAGHGAYGHRDGPFGHDPFAWSSPWQKLVFLKAHIIFLGVSLRYNTLKHLIEYRLAEIWCERIADDRRRCAALAALSRFREDGVWPWLNGDRVAGLLDGQGLLRRAVCGQAELIAFRADACFDRVLAAALAAPQEWFDEKTLNWLATYQPDLDMKFQP